MAEKYNYHIPYKEVLTFVRSDGSQGSINASILFDAIDEFERIIEVFEDVEIPIGDILGLRNLSAFVGEVFNLACSKVSNGYVENNPHQDGYPDLLIMDAVGKSLWDSLKNRRREKDPFSPLKAGGIEVKATCGDLRSAKWFTKQGLEKPIIGDQRKEYVTGYNWKAHHRETNNLVGLIWDFIDSKPTIVALNYCNYLTEEDWGKTVTPKEGGGRTTSVSIMNKDGVSKMYKGIILSLNDCDYTNKMFSRLSKY